MNLLLRKKSFRLTYFCQEACSELISSTWEIWEWRNCRSCCWNSWLKFACHIDTGSDISSTMSDTIVKFLDKKCVFLSTRGNSDSQQLLAADGRPVKYFGESQICWLMRTKSRPLRLRNINGKIIQFSDTYTESRYEFAEEIFLENSLL